MPFQQAQLGAAPLQAEKRRRNRLYKQRTSGKTYLPAVPSRDDGRTIKMKILAPCDKTSIGTCPLKYESEVARMLKTPAVRFGGNANNGNCAARYVNANNACTNATWSYGGSAQAQEKD
jgi:hypothetical protein